MDKNSGYYSIDAVNAEHEQIIKEFGILGEEIEELKAENKRLKQERDKLKEILDKHVLMKMYPAKCTDKIQVFESRKEYNEVMKFIWKLMKEGNNL